MPAWECEIVPNKADGNANWDILETNLEIKDIKCVSIPFVLVVQSGGMQYRTMEVSRTFSPLFSGFYHHRHCTRMIVACEG